MGLMEKKDNFNATVYDYGFRIYKPEIAKFLSVDPLTQSYPWYTPYQFAGNTPIKFIDLDGLEPAKNPADATNQDGRNPAKTIDAVFNESGGNENFEKNFAHYLKGSYDANSKIHSSYNIDGYTSDSKDGAEKYNHLVNNSGVFYASEYESFSTRDFSNFLLGSMVSGVGPENIIFPTNGMVSNYLKDAGIANDAIISWYDLNKNKATLVSGIGEYSGNKHDPSTIISNGVFHPETFIGSASVTISPLNDKEIQVKIFNVTSLVSGDFEKHFPWNSYPISVVRDPSLLNGSESNKYGNTSQTYSFTLPIDKSRLK